MGVNCSSPDYFDSTENLLCIPNRPTESRIQSHNLSFSVPTRSSIFTLQPCWVPLNTAIFSQLSQQTPPFLGTEFSLFKFSAIVVKLKELPHNAKIFFCFVHLQIFSQISFLQAIMPNSNTFLHTHCQEFFLVLLCGPFTFIFAKSCSFFLTALIFG